MNKFVFVFLVATFALVNNAYSAELSCGICYHGTHYKKIDRYYIDSYYLIKTSKIGKEAYQELYNKCNNDYLIYKEQRKDAVEKYKGEIKPFRIFANEYLDMDNHNKKERSGDINFLDAKEKTATEDSDLNCDVVKSSKSHATIIEFKSLSHDEYRKQQDRAHGYPVNN